MKNASRLRGYAAGIVTLVVVFAVVRYVVVRYRPPGAMTVVEA